MFTAMTQSECSRPEEGDFMKAKEANKKHPIRVLMIATFSCLVSNLCRSLAAVSKFALHRIKLNCHISTLPRRERT